MSDNLESAIEKWKGQQSKYEQLFSPAVIDSKGFKMERLRQLNVIASLFAKEEKHNSTLRLLKIERQLLEKDIRVGFFTKWMNRVIDLLKAKKTATLQTKQESINHIVISSQLKKSGFGMYADSVSNRIRESAIPFAINHSTYITPNERMDYRLQFKPGTDGAIKFDGYTATLVNKVTKEERQQFHSLTGNNIVSASVAASLLQGKAFQDIKRNGQSRDWIQYDLNDKDADGNFRIIRYDGVQYEKQLREALNQLPLKDGNDQERKEELMVKLAQGKDVKVMLSGEKSELLASIHAHPRNGNITVLNEDGKVLDPHHINSKEQSIRPKQKEAIAKPKVKMRKVAV